MGKSANHKTANVAQATQLQELKDSRDIWVTKAEEWRTLGEKRKGDGASEAHVQECRDEYAYRMDKARALNAQIEAMEGGA